MKSRTNPSGRTETTLRLPAWWASALVNSDFSGITDAHENDTIHLAVTLFGCCVGCSDEAGFQSYHDASANNILAGDCLSYTFVSDKKGE